MDCWQISEFKLLLYAVWTHIKVQNSYQLIALKNIYTPVGIWVLITPSNALAFCLPHGTMTCSNLNSVKQIICHHRLYWYSSIKFQLIKVRAFHINRPGQVTQRTNQDIHVCVRACVTWKASLFLRCLRLSRSRVFCFSSSSSFSRARMCSSKQINASSLSMSKTHTHRGR